MSELLLIHDFLAPAVCAELLAELRRATGSPAGVDGAAPARTVDIRVRRATAIVPSQALRNLIAGQLRQAMPGIGAHFGVALTQCEEPQFLRYETGGHFVPHQDGNTPLLHNDSRFRRISAVIFLSTPSESPAHGDHGGGLLVIHGRYPDTGSRAPVPHKPGTLAAFRAETTHEVTPVTHGERYTIVAWYR